jgi:hypothetical protein
MKTREILGKATAMDLIYSLIPLGESGIMHIINRLQLAQTKTNGLIQYMIGNDFDEILILNKQKEIELVAAAIEQLSKYTKIHDWTLQTR